MREVEATFVVASLMSTAVTKSAELFASDRQDQLFYIDVIFGRCD